MWARKFWKSTAERAVSTAAQAAIAVVGADAMIPAYDIDVRYTGAVALTAGALAVLKALAAAYIGDKGTPSLIKGGE